jgi:uncharacterized protein (TIGR03067 family)
MPAKESQKISALKGLIISTVLLATGLATAQPAISDKVEPVMSDEVKNEVAKLNGTWTRDVDGKSFIFHFKQDSFASLSFFPDTTFATVARVTIDPTKTPKRMDLTFSAGTGRAERLKGTTQLDIYELDGDTLKFVAPRGPSRPEAFPDHESPEGEAYFYVVLRRAK